MTKRKHNFFYRNSLSIVLFLLFVFSIIGQIVAGYKQYNEFLVDYHVHEVSLWQYFLSGHFIQSTFENWESEFLQMALYVILTVFLRQQGSSESKKLDGEESSDKEPRIKADAPWPVRTGGIILSFYKNSLSIVLALLFAMSFLAHWYGSWKGYNTEQALMHKQLSGFGAYLGNSQLWFESFQNWQSEFFSVFMIIMLSIYLRQKGSPQSKPVDAPNSQTGG
jgi:hypothetical protein